MDPATGALFEARRADKWVTSLPSVVHNPLSAVSVFQQLYRLGKLAIELWKKEGKPLTVAKNMRHFEMVLQLCCSTKVKGCAIQ